MKHSHNSHKTHTIVTHSCFRGSMHCGTPTMKNSCQVTQILLDVQNASSVFLPGPKWPSAVVIWVACTALRESSKWSLRSGLMAPKSYDLHILTASLEKAELDLIHCCQLH